METVYIDTHVAVWLFQNDLSKFSDKVLGVLETNDLSVSAMVVMELEFLYEIGRLTYKPMEILSSLQKSIGLKVCEAKFSAVVYYSLDFDWTRDPFDRLIVANADYQNAQLISKDRNILENYKKAIW